LDNKEFGTTPAQKLSRVPEAIQVIVDAVLREEKDACEVTVDNARRIRDLYKDYTVKGSSDEAGVKSDIRKILTKKAVASESSPATKIIEMAAAQYERLFDEMEPEEVVAAVIAAVDYHRKSLYDKTSQDQLTAI
jgi:hypothetical protein